MKSISPFVVDSLVSNRSRRRAIARAVARIPASSLATATAAFLFSACASTFAQDSDNFGSDNGSGGHHGQPVKVMIISMFGPEGQVWLDKLGPWKAIHVAGLSPDYPVVLQSARRSA